MCVPNKKIGDLSSILAYLNKISENVDIQHLSVSYITKLTSSSDPVIFISKKNFKHSCPKEIFETDTSKDDKNLDVSTTGSPLKDICEIDLKNLSFNLELYTKGFSNSIENEFESIPRTEAANFINEINSNSFDIGNHSIWALCTDNNDDTVLLETNKKIDRMVRGVVKYMGCCHIGNINFNELFTKHFCFIENTKDVTTEIETFYNLNHNVSLKLFQKFHSTTISLSNFLNSEVVLNQSIEINNSNSILKDLWDQLLLLKKLNDHIIKCIDTDEDVHSLHSYEMRGSEFDNMKQKITKVLNGSYILKEDIDKYNNYIQSKDLVSVVSQSLNMNYIDITDQIFDVLQTCSYDKLKVIFCYIFQYAAKQTVLNMPTNSNRLAKLIKDISQRLYEIPHLTNLEFFAMFLEIGLEKITKQYEFILTNGNICSLYDLNMNENYKISITKPKSNPISGTQPKKIERKTLLYTKKIVNENSMDDFTVFNKIEVNTTFNKLGHIHMVLEHLLLMQNYFKLNTFNTSIVNQLFQRPSISLEEYLLMKTDKLELLISDTSSLREMTECDLSARRIYMFSENKYKKIGNVFYYSIDPIIPFNSLPNKAKEIESTTNSRECMVFHYLNIESKK